MDEEKVLKEKITYIAKRAIAEKVFPGCVVGLVRNSSKNVVLPFGNYIYALDAPRVEEDTVYDVASITKSIPTSSLALYLIDQKKLSLEDKMITYLPEYLGSYRDDITIKHLLTQTLHFSFSLSSKAHLSPEEIIFEIVHAKLLSAPGSNYYYVNATSILLGMVIEKVTQKSLAVLAQELFFSPLHMRQTTFSPQKNVPPTEIASSGEIIQGVVHDESARALLPRSVGSAGLFSSAPDLLVFLQMLLNKGEHAGTRFFSEETVGQMYTNQTPSLSLSVGLGWELGVPWMGRSGTKVFGKTGFTGCMVACSLEKETAVVLLANRTYPHRPVTGDAINQLRRSICDIVFAA